MDNYPSPKVGIPYADPEVRIKPEDEVKVMVYDRFGTLVHTYTARGMHNITEAVEAAYADSKRTDDKRDFTFRVTNLDSRASELYRLNAHGNLHLIV